VSLFGFFHASIGNATIASNSHLIRRNDRGRLLTAPSSSF